MNLNQRLNEEVEDLGPRVDKVIVTMAVRLRGEKESLESEPMEMSASKYREVLERLNNKGIRDFSQFSMKLKTGYTVWINPMDVSVIGFKELAQRYH